MATEALKVDDSFGYKTFEPIVTAVAGSKYERPDVTRAPTTPLSAHSFPRPQAAKQGQPAVGALPQLAGVINDLDDNFAYVTAFVGDERLSLNIPLELCPRETRMEGLSITITLNDGRFKGLKICAREPTRQAAKAHHAEINSILDWANSL